MNIHPVRNHLMQLAETQRAAQCMAVCRQCTEFDPRAGVVPFADRTSRERWMRDHDPDHHVVPLKGWPPPVVALRHVKRDKSPALAG